MVVPLAFIPMSHKTEGLYEAMFASLRNVIQADHIFCDNELALINGILSAWPEIKVKIVCFLKRSVSRFTRVYFTSINAKKECGVNLGGPMRCWNRIWTWQSF